MQIQTPHLKKANLFYDHLSFMMISQLKLFFISDPFSTLWSITEPVITSLHTPKLPHEK